MRRLIRQIVEKICEQVFECEDGLEALAVYRENQPDLVLMDVEMPRLDGINATVEIKKAFPAARIAIITKFTDRQTRQAALEAGALAFLGKDNLLALRELIKEQIQTEFISEKFNGATK